MLGQPKPTILGTQKVLSPYGIWLWSTCLARKLIIRNKRFFAPPVEGTGPEVPDSHEKESLNEDGALDAYSETVVWRLGGIHAMVRDVQRACF